MRLVLIVVSFSILTINASCQSKEPKAIVKKTITDKGLKMTTLDSLQGVWVSQKDKQDVLKISKDSILYYTGSKISVRSIIYIYNECSQEKEELQKRVKNGSFIIAYNENYDDFMCYEIEQLNQTTLNLFYEGKTLIYNRKK